MFRIQDTCKKMIPISDKPISKVIREKILFTADKSTMPGPVITL